MAEIVCNRGLAIGACDSNDRAIHLESLKAVFIYSPQHKPGKVACVPAKQVQSFYHKLAENNGESVF